MTKKQSIKKIVFTALILVVGFVLCFGKFNIPFTDYTYNGFINSIKLGLDIKGGVTAVYDTKLPENSTSDLNTAVTSTVSRLSSLLSSRGYTEATVTTQSGTRIRVEVPDVDDPQVIFDLIGSPAKLYFTDAESDNPSKDAVISGDDISSMSYSMQNNEHGVVIKFNAKGTQKFTELTQKHVESGEPVYVYLGTELYTKLTVNEAITSGSTFISGSMDTREEAEEFLLKLQSGTFEAELSLLESSVVSATLGKNAIESGLIAGIIGLILIMIFMIVVYRMFGVCASFALLFYVILVLFFLQAVPLVQLTLPGIAGIILGIGMAVDANVIIFERIKDEYKRGKKIPASIESGFKRARIAILDSNITTLLVCIVLYIFGTGSIQGFAITLFISIVVSMFTALVVTKALIKLYLPFNSRNGEKYNLYREVDTDEIQ